MKKLFAALIVLIAGAGIVAGFAAMQMKQFLAAPINVPEAGASFEIRAGSSFHAVARELAEQGIIDKPVWLRAYARYAKLDGSIHSGEYQLESGTTTRELLDQFTVGDVVLYSFTLIEGWNQWDLMRALDAHPEIVVDLADSDWPAFLDELGAEADHPEGLFLPETYHFPRATSSRELLRQAYSLMQETLAAAWEKRAVGLPLASPYEALVLASIVEKETARADERAKIAGVFIRRLQQRMRLQTDPTVIYGIGRNFNGNLTRTDLRTDTPYNTYTRGGLPPTPIAMPGKDAIRAALSPEDGTALYFVATGLSDGSHTFSATKEEHDQAVQAYLRQLRQNRQGGR